MLSFATFTVSSLLTTAAFASPIEKRTWCLNDAQAQTVATNYGNLIAAYTNASADYALSPGFTDYSESVNTLIDECPQGAAAQTLPLLSPTFTNRTAFEIGQGQQHAINFRQLNIWHSCDTVFIRWETTNTAPIPSPRPVVGMITMETCPGAKGQSEYVIDTVYSEFDAGAWLANLQEITPPICGKPADATTTTTTVPSATAASGQLGN